MTHFSAGISVTGILSVLLLCGPAFTDDARVQFCWALGKLDNTVYFAEAETREDRQASFDQLLEISGIDHHPAQCRRSDVSVRARLLKEWRDSELQAVDTTFLSDLDY